jgi:Predicted transcriptional regulators
MDQVKIGKFIAELRHEHNLTQESLGEKLGVTNKTISRWENGNYMPDVEMLQALSGEFQVSINELLCGERISEADYREKADENLIALLAEEVFTREEKCSFWRKKWLKDHVALLILLVATAIAVGIGLWYIQSPVLNAVAWVAVCVTGIKLRSDRAGYIEGKIYQSKNHD